VSRPPSLLSRGAPLADEPPLVPWFKDSDKLLKAVLNRAAVDPESAARVVIAIGRLAQQKPGLRKRLALSAAGGRKGAPRRPLVELALVADLFQHLQATMGRGASAACVRWIIDGPAFPRIESDTGAKNLLKAARAEFPFGSMGKGKSQSVS
jgi:hypothetical protein